VDGSKKHVTTLANKNAGEVLAANSVLSKKFGAGRKVSIFKTALFLARARWAYCHETTARTK